MVYECGNIRVVEQEGDDIFGTRTAFRVRVASVDIPSTVEAGSDFPLQYTLEGFGTGTSRLAVVPYIAGEEASYWLSYELSGDERDSAPPFYSADAPTEPGVYDVILVPGTNVVGTTPYPENGVSAGRIEVFESFSSDDVFIEGCSTSDDVGVATIDEITASASIRNDNSVAAEVTIDFSGGSMENTVRELIPASSTKTITSGFIFSSEGTKTIEVTVDSANRTRGSVT